MVENCSTLKLCHNYVQNDLAGKTGQHLHYSIHLSKEKGLKIAQHLNYATTMYKMTWPVRHRFQIAPFRHQTNCRQPDMRLVDPA